MKILIVSAFFENAESIASQRPLSWAKYWSLDGHDVEVITVSKVPYKRKVFQSKYCYNITGIGTKLLGSLKFVYCKSDVGAVSNKSEKFLSVVRKALVKLQDRFCKPMGIFYSSRMPDFLDIWYFNVKKYVKDQKYDLVVTTHGPYQPNLIGHYLKRNNRVKYWIADYRDLWTQSHNFKGLFPFTIYEEYLEKKINKTADIITTVSQPLAKKLRSKYDLTNVYVIENGYDRDDLIGLNPSRYWPNDAKVRMVYTGTIYEKYQDPSALFEAIRNIRQSSSRNLLSNLEVHFFGINNFHLSKLIEKFSVEDYVFQNGVIKRSDSLRAQRDADILLFMEFKKSGAKGILTGKLFEYISSGTQIWGINTSRSSCPGELISNYGAGVLFDGSTLMIEKQLKNVLCHKHCSKIQPNLFDKYSRRNLSIKMLKLVEDLSNEKQGK